MNEDASKKGDIDHRNDAQELLVRYSQSCSLQNLEGTVMIVASRRLIG